MNPFEALYGRRCNTPISLDDPVNRVTIGLDMLKEMEQEVISIIQNLKEATDRQKSYKDLQ